MIAHLARFWLTFESPVNRAAYLKHGFALALLKYGGDALLVGTGTGAFWSPFDYMQSVPFLLDETFANAPGYLAPALAVWTMPFLWIGVTMSMRRALDAGWSAWAALLFFVPYANYGLMLTLAALPTSGRTSGLRVAPRPQEARLPSALLAIGAGSATGLGILILSVRLLNSYGLALFLGAPFVIGTVTGFLLCRRYPASLRETHEAVTMTMLLIGGVAFLLGTEGAVCLLMMLPLGIVLALMGGAMGRAIARLGTGTASHAAIVVLMLPSAAAWEAGTETVVLREVQSAIEIDATTEVVWNHVIAFSPLPEPTELLFRLGVAYPMRAEIEGKGVGAMRYCVFSTGRFVEPITRWEPGRRLSFDVIESPPPMKEWSFYEGVAPPHLEGYLVPRRGEFRLVALPNGRTRLEGSTWYEQRLRPEGYWVLFSDAIIRRIHLRVLEHIALLAE
ncbi:MAG: hypothetical protein O7I93_15280 [Gemmatimonadetes bacterium]|nr:hypothetical protein [Gemmatimonadota bacterium]